MTEFDLIIGNKNLSSWSLRPWLVMTHFDIEFREELIHLDQPGSRAILKQASPSCLVPCLRHKNVSVWESLAICEYLADLFPDKHLWPEDLQIRAHSRAISAQMHSGFTALRETWPMEFCRTNLAVHQGPGVRRDVEKIIHLWEQARSRYGVKAGGPFLYGDFSIADAMFAPVVSRFKTYGPVEMPPSVEIFYDAVLALPAMQKWGAGAKLELNW
ncbi:MAG: glutathione S-transferase family protein [Parvularculaceae bacterium]